MKKIKLRKYEKPKVGCNNCLGFGVARTAQQEEYKCPCVKPFCKHCLKINSDGHYGICAYCHWDNL